MMAFGFMEILLLLLGGGGGNDLLDYMPAQAYWKAKGVEVTVERLAAELVVAEPADLPKLIRDLGADAFADREAASRKLRAIGPAAAPALKEAAKSDDPEVSARARDILKTLPEGGYARTVRRLMAIRSLGELKKPEGVAALQPLLASKQLFVADYARQAIATIQGKPYGRPRPDKATLWRDVCLLPRACGVVAQTALPGGGPVSFDKALEGAGPALRPGMDPEQVLAQAVQMLSMVADRVGNLRIHAVTLGVAGDIGDRQGFVVVVGRGLYDATAAKAAIAQTGVVARAVGGVEVFSPESEVNLIPFSDELFVIAIAPNRDEAIAADVVATLKAKPTTPRLDPKMLELLKAIDTAAPLWGVARLTDTYRQVSLFAPFDTASLTSQRKDDAMALKLVARGKDPAAVAKSAEELNKGLAEGKAETKRMAEQMPVARPLAEFLDSIAIETQGATLTMTGKLKGTSSALMMPMMMFFGVRASAPGQPPPNAVAPVQPRRR